MLSVKMQQFGLGLNVLSLWTYPEYHGPTYEMSHRKWSISYDKLNKKCA